MYKYTKVFHLVMAATKGGEGGGKEKEKEKKKGKEQNQELLSSSLLRPSVVLLDEDCTHDTSSLSISTDFFSTE